MDDQVSQTVIDSIRSTTSAWGGLSWGAASEAHPTEQPEVHPDYVPVDADQ